MDDLPPPDLRDHQGRVHRIVLSLAVGIAVGAIAWSLVFRRWQAERVPEAHARIRPHATTAPAAETKPEIKSES